MPPIRGRRHLDYRASSIPLSAASYWQAAEKVFAACSSLLSPPGQGEKIEEGSHPIRRVLLQVGITPGFGTLFPHPARRLLPKRGACSISAGCERLLSTARSCCK